MSAAIVGKPDFRAKSHIALERSALTTGTVVSKISGDVPGAGTQVENRARDRFHERVQRSSIEAAYLPVHRRSRRRTAQPRDRSCAGPYRSPAPLCRARQVRCSSIASDQVSWRPFGFRSIGFCAITARESGSLAAGSRSWVRSSRR